MKRTQKQTTLRTFVAAFSLFLLLTGGYAGYEISMGNFHAITPGEAYRSAQLSKGQLEHYVKTYGIRSILNLRGNKSDEEVAEEIKVSSELKLAYYYVPLSSTAEPTGQDVSQLMEVFRSAPRPILIHCKAGADRSGLVAAMWKVVVDKEPKSVAEKQLSVFYGHIPFSKTSVMDRFFENWQPPR